MRLIVTMCKKKSDARRTIPIHHILFTFENIEFIITMLVGVFFLLIYAHIF